MKFISKTLSLFILSTALLVNAKNECDELKNDLGDKVKIVECKNDDEGKISLLEINDLGMKEEDFKKVQSYDTISDFSYTLSNGNINEKSGYPTSIDYLTNLKNLKNLEKLYIGYYTYKMNCSPAYSSYPECYTYYTAPIGKNTFKDLKNLKELTLYRIDLHQDNINEISTLNNLKSLNTKSTIFEKISDSKVLNNLDNMNSFTYSASVVLGITILPMELLNNIKSLKKLNIDLYSNFHGAASFLHDELNLEFTDKSNIENLYLHGIKIKNNTVDEILKLNNIKELTFDTCIFDLEDDEYAKLENLGNRCPIEITYDGCEYQEPLENVNNKNCKSTTTEEISTTTKKTTTETTTKESTTTTTKKSTTTKNIKKTTTNKKSTTTKTTKKTTTNKKSTSSKTTKKTTTNKKSTTTKTTKKTTTNKKSTTSKTTKKTTTNKKSTTTKTTKKTTTNKKSTTTKTTKKTTTNKKSTTAKTTKKTTTNKKSTTAKTTKKTSNKKSTTKTTKNIPTSTSRHGKCGPRFGSCKKDYCCSKYGYCGKTDKFCGKGCQSEYGFCN